MWKAQLISPFFWSCLETWSAQWSVTWERDDRIEACIEGVECELALPPSSALEVSTKTKRQQNKMWDEGAEFQTSPTCDHIQSLFTNAIYAEGFYSTRFQTVESLMQNQWLATALDVQRDMYLMGQSMYINSFPYHIKLQSPLRITIVSAVHFISDHCSNYLHGYLGMSLRVSPLLKLGCTFFSFFASSSLLSDASEIRRLLLFVSLTEG